jgi:dienelactone hydrolase
MMKKVKRSDFLKTVAAACAYFGVATSSLSHALQSRSALPPVLIDSQGNPIKTLRAWKEQRMVLTRRWVDYLGALKPNRHTPVLTVLKEDHPENLIRQLVSYEGEEGIMVKGYLIKPNNITTPVPGVVAMHSTSDTEMEYIAGIKEGPIVPFGYRLAKQGFVVFCPQCFLMHDKGELSYEQVALRFKKTHSGSKGMAKMLFDAQRAVDVLASLDEVDSNRIGATGHSLGAKEVFYLGAFDDRVKVIVSNEGGIGIDFSNWDDVWYLGKEIHDFKHQHHELLALVAAKEFLLIGGGFADGEKSRPYIEAVLPVYELYGKPQNISLYVHAEGHLVTPEAEQRTYQWLRERL